MNKMAKKLITIASATLLTASMFIGCSSNAQTVGENKTLRVGVMSAADAAPILLAKEKGYFEEAGVDLQLEIFTNGATKQSSIQAGELDGAMVSIIQFLNNKQAGLDARITTTTDGVFPVVLQKDFVEQKDVKVGLMEISVVNYLADQYLKDYNVEKVYINEMPVRLQMLLEGKLNMAVLPEPLASNAQLKGLEKRVYGEPEDFTPNAMIFTEEITMVPNAKNRRGNSTYRLEALGSLHTYKRAHAVTWAFNLLSRPPLKFPRFLKRDSKRMLQLSI